MKYILGGLPNIPAIRALRITGSSGIAIFNSLLHIFVADPILSRKENWWFVQTTCVKKRKKILKHTIWTWSCLKVFEELVLKLI